MDFDSARQRKFEQGRKEHGQPWDAGHIDARREMQDECLDLFNYAELLGDEVRQGSASSSRCRDTWTELEEMGG